MRKRAAGLPQRAVLGVLLAAGGVLALYLLAANVLLRTGLLRSLINSSPDRTWVEYESAWSLWPGRVRFRRLSVRDQDMGAQWMFELAEGHLTYALTDLARRRFHPTSLRGKGLIFRARRRVPADRADRELLSAIPPIPGLPDPPLLNPGERPRPRTGKEWTLHVQDIRVEGVREIWIDRFRWRGEGTLRGGLFLRPKTQAHVYPSVLDLASGTLVMGKDPVVGEVRGRFASEIGPWDPNRYPGNAVFYVVKGNARLKGSLSSLAFVNRLLHGYPVPRFSTGHGNLDLQVALDHGHGDGTLDLTANRVSARIAEARLLGDAKGRARITNLDMKKGTANLEGSWLDLQDVSVRRGGETTTAQWWGRLRISPAQVRAGSGLDAAGTVTVRARDARPLFALFAAKLPGWAEKALTLEGLTGRARLELARSRLEIEDLRASGGKVEIQGEYRIRGHVNRGTFLIDVGLLSVGLAVDAGKAKVRVLTPRKWFRERTGRALAE